MNLQDIILEPTPTATPVPESTTQVKGENGDDSNVGEKEVIEDSHIKQEEQEMEEGLTKGEVTANDTPQRTPQPQVQQPTQEPVVKQEIVETSNLPPLHEVVGGSSVRRYLNKHLTQHILDGLKEVGHARPEDPLKYLGEFLIARSIYQHRLEEEGEN